MITKIEIEDENKLGTLTVMERGLEICFGHRLIRFVKIEPWKLQGMIDEGKKPEGKNFLACYDGNIIFKIPDDSQVTMGIKKTFPVTKPDKPKQNYIFIKTTHEERSFSPAELLFEIREIKESISLLKTRSHKRKVETT
jgi:hypothetical protein